MMTSVTATTPASPGGAPMSTTTDAEGRFTFAVPPGTFAVNLATQSLPPGYSMAGPSERQVSVGTDTPQSLTFDLQVRRSIGGRAAGAKEVRIDSLGKTAPTDADGNFLFRSMPAGTFTLTALVHGKPVSSVVTLPPAPAMISDILFGEGNGSQIAERNAAASPTARTGAASDHAARDRAAANVLVPNRAGQDHAVPDGNASGRSTSDRGALDRPTPSVPTGLPGATSVRFHVHAGAFRSYANAVEAQQQIERAGGAATITQNGTMNLVTLGPFASRASAEAAADRMTSAGIDTYMTAERGIATPMLRVAGGFRIVQPAHCHDRDDAPADRTSCNSAHSVNRAMHAN